MKKTQSTVLDAVRDAVIAFGEERHIYFISVPGTNDKLTVDHNENSNKNANSAYRNNAKYFGKRIHRKIEMFLKEKLKPENLLVQNY